LGTHQKEKNIMHMDKQGKDWNEGRPDHEGEMAVSQLHRIAEMANELLEMIGENDELPGWIQYKITRAFNDLGDAYNYIEAQHHMDQSSPSLEMPLGMEEGKKKKGGKGLWHNIHKRRRAGKRPKRPGEKGYPKTLDINELKSLIKNLIAEDSKGPG
jgi:hypothetical protein